MRPSLIDSINACSAPSAPLRRLRGFTLIELMIVVAIIGILAAIAIPAYMDHTIRAQISEGINLTADAKTAVTAYFQERGTFPTDNDEAAMPAAARIKGRYVTSITVSGADVSVRYGNEASPRISGQTITLSATSVAGSLTWSCASDGAIEDRFLPRACN